MHPMPRSFRNVPLLWAMVLFAAGCSANNSPMPQAAPLRLIEVTLDQHFGRIKGIPSWPKENGRRSPLYRTIDPAEVELSFGGPNSFRTYSRMTDIHISDKGRVKTVYLLPFPQAIPFPDALKELQHIATDLGVAESESFDVAFLQDSRPGSRQTLCIINSTTVVMLGTKHNNTNLYYIFLEFAIMPDFMKELQKESIP